MRHFARSTLLSSFVRNRRCAATMSPSFAFHIAPRALDLQRAFSPRNLFADTVRHVIDGHVAGDRYYEIATHGSAVALNECALEGRMRQLFALDLNPLISMTRQLRSESGLFRAWNTYQKNVSLAVRTEIRGGPHVSLRVARHQVAYDFDPPAARNAGLCAIDILADAARKNRKWDHVVGEGVGLNLSGIAAELGLQRTAIFDVSRCFEEFPGENVAALSRRLGVHRRTLERQFREFGLTVVNLKMANALVGATNSLWQSVSLTEIAYGHGFSDQAHMTRAFRRACGLSPSVLRKLSGHFELGH